MARNRKEPKIKLKQPDRSGPDPTQQTLLDLAQQRGLLKDPEEEHDDGQVDEESLVGRLGEAILWSISLTMVHFTLDVLVANQYAVDIEWPVLISRALQAFPIILLLFYIFHPHSSPPLYLPRLHPRIQPLLHQLLFFVGAVCAGSYLIHITNNHGYYAVMKKAPPIGILWIWSVIELDLLWAVGSLAACGVFLWVGGYSIF